MATIRFEMGGSRACNVVMACNDALTMLQRGEYMRQWGRNMLVRALWLQPVHNGAASVGCIASALCIHARQSTDYPLRVQ